MDLKVNGQTDQTEPNCQLHTVYLPCCSFFVFFTLFICVCIVFNQIFQSKMGCVISTVTMCMDPHFENLPRPSGDFWHTLFKHGTNLILSYTLFRMDSVHTGMQGDIYPVVLASGFQHSPFF